jgi:hypothetical protein
VTLRARIVTNLPPDVSAPDGVENPSGSRPIFEGVPSAFVSS